jgi:5'-phosphate synthase pdxT subunit
MRLHDEPILVRQGAVIASTFHPEMSRDRRVHAMFCREAAAAAKATTVAANTGERKDVSGAS